MVPNLMEATNQYWRQLNQLEAAYKRGEISIEEVDVRVAQLTTELGQQRHAAIHFLLDGLRHFWSEQQEMIIGIGFVAAIAYIWSMIQ